MKQNSCPVVGEVAKSTRIGLDELDGTVEAFSASVADSVLAEVEQPFLVAPEHVDDLLHRLQATPHCIIRPGFEVALGGSFVAGAPELGEVFFDAPSSTGFQIELVQGTKRDGFSAAPIWILFQPSPLAARQWRLACLGQATVLLLSDSIHRLTQVLGDVKLVMHDVRVRHALPGCTPIRRPHIHGHRLDRHTLCRSKRFQQANGRSKRPLGNQVS